MKERRRVKRVVITCVAEVTSLSSHQEIEGYVTNISRNGLGMMARKKIDNGENVLIKLSFFGMDGVNEVENVRGKIQRIHPLANVYSIGIKFERLDGKDNASLLSYIDSAEKAL